MTSVPPLLPEVVLGRVLRVARFDGGGALILGALFAVASAAVRDVPFAAVGLLAAGAGAIELHGVALLRTGDARGMNWLMASQLVLLVAILGYCGLRVGYVEVPELPEKMKTLVTTSAQQLGMSVEEYFRFVNRLTAGVVAVVSLLYQGGMALYYARRRQAVAQALTLE